MISRHFTSYTPLYGFLYRTPATALTRLQLGGIRGIKRIQFTSPWGIRFFKGSRVFLSIVGTIYGGIILTVGGTYFYTTYTVSKFQPVPSEWTFMQRVIALAGANHHNEGRYKQTVTYYKDLVRKLTLNDGGLVDLNRKSPEWLAGYSDVTIRLGLSQGHTGDSGEAKAALESAYQIPFGQSSLKSQAAVQLGKYALENYDLTQAEDYFRQAVEHVNAAAISKTDKGSIVLRPRIKVTDDIISPLMDLGRIYVMKGDLQQALALYLSIERGIKYSGEAGQSYQDKNCNEALAMSRIAELLWGLSSRHEAIVWSEGSYYEAVPRSRYSVECASCAQMAADLTSKMYKGLKMMNESNKFKVLSEVN